MSDLFNSSVCLGVVEGHCVMLEDTADGDQEIVYAGPLNGAPDVSGKLVLLHKSDFEKLKRKVDSGRH